MADNSVFINGVTDGAFEEAFGNLPPWATQSTAERIQSVLEKNLPSQTKLLEEIVKSASAKGMSPDQLKKLSDEIDKYLKNLKKINDEEAPKEKKRNKEKEDQHNKEKKWQKDSKGQIDVLQTLLVSAGAQIAKAMISNADIFDKMYQSGIDVVDGMEGTKDGFDSLRQLTAQTGVRYTELAKAMEKYSTAVNSFGVGKFAKTLAGASSQLTSFGYNTKETADLLGVYLDSQKGFSNVNSKTQAQVQSDLVKFGERITRLSQATGIMREKLLQDVDAISQSVEANILAGQIGAEGAEKTSEFIASFKDKNLGQAILHMMTDAIKPLNETFMDFQKTGFGGFGQKLQAFTQSLEGLDPEEAQRRTAEFAKANENELQYMIQRGNFLKNAGVKEAAGVTSIATSLLQQGRNYKEVSEQDKKKLDATAKANKDLQNAQERLTSQWQRLFGPTTKMLDMFTFILTQINKVVDLFADMVSGVEKWINSFDIIKKTFGEIQLLPWAGLGVVIWSTVKGFNMLGQILSKGLGSVGSLFSSIARISGIFVRFLGPVALLYTAFQLGSAIGEVLYETLSEMQWFNDFTDAVFSGIEKTWNWIGDLFNSIGNMLSSSVTTVFSGIEKAWSWIGSVLYEALSKMKWFNDATGVIFSGIEKTWSWISDLFKVVGDVLSAVTGVLGRILSKFVDKMIPDFAKSWFSGDSKTSNPSAIAGTNTNASKVEQPKISVIKSPAPSTLNSPSQVSTKPSVETEKAQAKEPTKSVGAGIEKPPTDSSINTTLGYQSSLLEQLLQSTNNLVSVNKDILKYSKIT